jgi:hypothetical protein
VLFDFVVRLLLRVLSCLVLVSPFISYPSNYNTNNLHEMMLTSSLNQTAAFSHEVACNWKKSDADW